MSADPDRESLFASGPIEADVGGDGAKRKAASVVDQKAELSGQCVQILVGGERGFKRLGGVGHITSPIKAGKRAHQNVANGFGRGILVDEAKAIERFDQQGQALAAYPAHLQIGAGRKIEKPVAMGASGLREPAQRRRR